MIDTLIRLQDLATDNRRVSQVQRKYLGFNNHSNSTYALVTLHRPSNVDNREILIEIIEAFEEISRDVPILFPIHPRTRERLEDLRLRADNPKLRFIKPIGYLEFLSLQKGATLVITDSGGIQEETTFLGVPCLTVRENTERPITVEVGTNILVGQDMDRLQEEVHKILDGKGKKGKVPPLWDGKAGERIAEVISVWGQ
jgi:UDP-N-acetylglucosamine 2-epimerase (non-hydrolysing)